MRYLQIPHVVAHRVLNSNDNELRYSLWIQPLWRHLTGTDARWRKAVAHVTYVAPRDGNSLFIQFDGVVPGTEMLGWFQRSLLGRRASPMYVPNVQTHHTAIGMIVKNSLITRISPCRNCVRSWQFSFATCICTKLRIKRNWARSQCNATENKQLFQTA